MHCTDVGTTLQVTFLITCCSVQFDLLPKFLEETLMAYMHQVCMNAICKAHKREIYRKYIEGLTIQSHVSSYHHPNNIMA